MTTDRQAKGAAALGHLAVAVGTTFGSGYSPVAPGTAGAVVTLFALWFLPMPSVMVFSHLIVLFFLLGVWAAGICEKRWGTDPGRVNWDETVGMMVAVIALPKTLAAYGSAFLLFRIFDVIKPFPVNRAERLPAGWGIMIDDVVAGLYANVILQILLRLV